MSEGYAALGQAIGQIAGSGIQIAAQKDAASKEFQRQRQFAQEGIQWRVRDAMAAGVHPLYAIGANTPTYSPAQFVDPGFSSAFGSMGQALGRSARAGSSADTNEMIDLQKQLLRAQIGREQANTAATWSRIDERLQGQVGPGIMPGPSDPAAMHSGQTPGDARGRDIVRITPSESESRSSADSGYAAAIPPGLQQYDLGQGLRFTLPGKQMSEPLESMSESLLLMLAFLAKSERDRPGTINQMIDVLPDWLRRRVHGAKELIGRAASGADAVSDFISNVMRWEPRRRGYPQDR